MAAAAKYDRSKYLNLKQEAPKNKITVLQDGFIVTNLKTGSMYFRKFDNWHFKPKGDEMYEQSKETIHKVGEAWIEFHVRKYNDDQTL